MYNYICLKCESETLHFTFAKFGDMIQEPCETCGNIGLIRTVSNFGIGLSLPEHFNHSTGQYVTNRRAFSDQLKAKSDEMSERLNMDCNYKEVDSSDQKALGVTTEGLHEFVERAPETDTTKRKQMSKAFSI